MLVSAPVATTQAVPGGVERRAEAMEGRKGVVCGGTRGVGRRWVPSRPDSPSGYSISFYSIVQFDG